MVLYFLGQLSYLSLIWRDELALEKVKPSPWRRSRFRSPVIVPDLKNNESRQVGRRIGPFLMFVITSAECKMSWRLSEGQRNQCRSVFLFGVRAVRPPYHFKSSLSRFLSLVFSLRSFLLFSKKCFKFLCMESGPARFDEVFFVCVSQVV